MNYQEPRSPDQQAHEPDSRARGGPPDETSRPSAIPERAAPHGWSSCLAAIPFWVTQRPIAWRVLMLGAVVVAVIALIIWSRASSTESPLQAAPDTRVFFVSNQPELVFEHFVGNVHVVPGPDGQVSIKEKKNGETDAIQTRYSQHGDTITVTADIPGGLMLDTWVDYDVTVPRHAGLAATVATGTLEAADLSGPIALSNTNGSIWATNLDGSVSLKTQSGSINLTHVTGQVTAATQNGTITTTATRLGGHSRLQADNGTINFHGMLSPDGSYLFQNRDGAVGLTLPADSTFAVKAATTSGSIDTDFRGVSISHQDGRTEAKGMIGRPPQARLTIQTAGGSIHLFRGA
jgi:hypothetical protein